MKKMRNGRRGFTLLEIVIVVAIIVILSTGAFLGVAATVNRASDAQEQLAINNGENFEVYARNQVDSYGKDMVYWDPIPNYTPENQAKKMKEQMMAEGWTDGEITFEYQSDGWHIVAEWDPTLEEHRGFQTPEDYKLWLSNYNHYIALGYSAEEIEAGCKNGSTDIKPVWDASKHGGVSEEDYLKQKDKDTTPTEPISDKPNTESDKPNTEPDTPNTDSDKPTGSRPANISNLSGSVTTGSATTASATVSSPNNQGSTEAYNVSVSSGNGSMVYSVTIKVTGGNPSLDNPDYRYSIKDEGDGKFTITYTKNNQWNQPMDKPTFRITTDTGSGCSVEVDSIEYYSE